MWPPFFRKRLISAWAGSGCRSPRKAWCKCCLLSPIIQTCTHLIQTCTQIICCISADPKTSNILWLSSSSSSSSSSSPSQMFQFYPIFVAVGGHFILVPFWSHHVTAGICRDLVYRRSFKKKLVQPGLKIPILHGYQKPGTLSTLK